MKRANAAFAFAVIIIGLVIASYSFGKIVNDTTLYSRDSIELNGVSSYSFDVGVNLQGKYNALVKGYAGSVGCCTDYYIVNDTIEPTWVTSNASMKTELALIHLNSSQVSSQSLSGQFSFVPHSSDGYMIFFVNDNYPNATSESVHSNLVLQYSSYEWLYYTVAGLVVFLGGAIFALILVLKRSNKIKDTSQLKP